MPRIFQKRSGTWVEIKSIFQKQSGTWTEILNVFQKIGGTWTRVFSGLKIPGNTVAPTITGTGYLFSTLTNSSLGTWTNSPTTYTRQWRRGNPSSGGGEPTSYSNITGATSSTYTTTSADDGKYIICQVTATNTVGSNSAASNSIYISKYAPVALGTYSVSGGLLVGSTLTATAQIGTWKVTTDNTDDTYPDTFIYEWSDTNGNILQETSSNTYLIASGDLNKTLRLRVKGTNTGGEAYTSYQSLGTVTSAYRFQFGNNLYVSSNGHIGLDSGSSSYTSMSAGRNIAVFVKDFQQYYLAEYSDSSVYYLYIRGYLYNSSASSVNALDYQIKFYNDTSINYCDIYIVRKGSNVAALSDIDPGYYSSGTTGYAGMVGPYFIGAGTVFRVYFGDQAGTTSGIPWTAVNDNLWDVIQTWTGQGAGGLGIDDTFTTVTSAPNQSAPFPTNTVAPTLTTDTGNFSAGSTITLNAGTWSNASSYSYEILYASTTPVDTGSSATKTLVNTNQYVITNADATNPSYYFRGRVTGYSGSGQTGNSAIAVTTTSSRSNINPTTTISVGTATSNGFTISGTAGPLSGFGSTYANITSIQIFNSSQSLISTITTGLPTVNGTTGSWSYVWTGGSGSTTYYAKATVAATDTAQTTFTTGFSSAIATVGVPSQISAPTARATNTFSTSVVKYLDSITWSSGTYSNASSVSSVLLYSTNTSNLVAPGGNTSSSFRTANPYTLSTVDGSPPAYIFAVRDTVLGINGITYYFYSNQITSALADGISFSYGTATSTSGGWTASINSAAQSGASYSYVSATAGSGSVNSSTGAVTATGLSSNQSSTITVQKSVSGYNNITSTASGQSGIVATTPSAPTNLSVDNITFTSARINWNAPTNNGGATITGYEVNRDGGGFFSVGNVLNYTYTLTAGTYSIGVRAVNSAGSGTAAYINVTIPSFTVPTCVAPSLQFQRLTSSSILRWYCDYPTPSGDWSSITGMQFEIRTTAGGGTLLASGTRSFPGFGVYPYSAAGTIWAFRMGTQDGDISYSTSARFGRARVVMVGTNGTTYFGTWSAWI